MKAALIAVGSELLLPGRRETNTVWLAERLVQTGWSIGARVVVRDDLAAIAAAVEAVQQESDAVFLTGGIGPTDDDRTREALSRALRRPLERDPEVASELARRLTARGVSYGPDQARQADRPRGAKWLVNPLGSAPGLWIDGTDCLLVALPGVPAEMRAMFEALCPRLPHAGGSSQTRIVQIAGRGEVEIDRRLRDLYDTPGLEATILSGTGRIELVLHARGNDQRQVSRVLDSVEDEIRSRLGPDVFGVAGDTLAGVVGALLVEAGTTVAVAESCTAGLLAAALTEPPGSSAWFRGGLIVYDDELKQRLAGVRRETLERHGAVSAETARELAAGARDRCGAGVGLGVTGIAGPTGGTPGKPVGTVHLALRDGTGARHWPLGLSGDRATIRRKTVAAALDGLRRRLMVAE